MGRAKASVQPELHPGGGVGPWAIGLPPVRSPCSQPIGAQMPRPPELGPQTLSSLRPPGASYLDLLFGYLENCAIQSRPSLIFSYLNILGFPTSAILPLPIMGYLEEDSPTPSSCSGQPSLPLHTEKHLEPFLLYLIRIGVPDFSWKLAHHLPCSHREGITDWHIPQPLYCVDSTQA